MREIINEIKEYQKTFSTIFSEIEQIFNSINAMQEGSIFNTNSIMNTISGNFETQYTFPEIDDFEKNLSVYLNSKQAFINFTQKRIETEPGNENTPLAYNYSNNKNLHPDIALLNEYNSLMNELYENIRQAKLCRSEIQKFQQNQNRQQKINQIPQTMPSTSANFWQNLQKDRELAEKGDIKANISQGILHQRFASKNLDYKEQAVNEASKYYVKALKSAREQNTPESPALAMYAQNLLKNLGRDEDGKVIVDSTSNVDYFPPSPY